MTKEEYFKAKEEIKKQQGLLSDTFNQLREQYIEENKPCDVNDKVNIVTAGGRTIKGKALGFTVNVFGTVFVEKVKPEKGAICYLSVAPISTTVIV